jgi:hypothetical protein
MQSQWKFGHGGYCSRWSHFAQNASIVSSPATTASG